jgi:hypothetical protein
MDVFIAIWDSKATPLAEQWRDARGTRHVKIMYPTAGLEAVAESLKQVGGTVKQSRTTRPKVA